MLLCTSCRRTSLLLLLLCLFLPKRRGIVGNGGRLLLCCSQLLQHTLEHFLFYIQSLQLSSCYTLNLFQCIFFNLQSCLDILNTTCTTLELASREQDTRQQSYPYFHVSKLCRSHHQFIRHEYYNMILFMLDSLYFICFILRTLADEHQPDQVTCQLGLDLNLKPVT